VLGGEAPVRRLVERFYDIMDSAPEAASLRRMHAPYAIGAAERDQWLACMTRALDDVGASPEVKTMVTPALRRVAEALRNR
jgi:hemoglobin